MTEVAIQKGDVATPVGTLSCTLRAAKRVNAVFGNYTTAQHRLSGVDFDASCEIVAAGLGKTVAEVEEAVFRAGTTRLIEPLARYVNLLANAGDPIPAKGEDTKKPGEG